MSEELKPCPFCGGEAELVTGAHRDGGYIENCACVRCKKCGARSYEFHECVTPDEVQGYASETWNRRAERTRHDDDERREVARRLREGMENRDDGFIDVVESAVFGDDLYHSSESTLERMADLIEPAAWRDFAADPPSEKRPVLCKSRNGKYYVGSPCFFANDTFTGKVWVPRGGNYRRPEKWMEIDAATCEKCDREALIELADEIRALNENAEIHLFNTVRISDMTLTAIELRIREAVGA